MRARRYDSDVVEAPAGFGRRLMAATIDTAVLGLMLLGLSAVGFVALVMVAVIVPASQEDPRVTAAVAPIALVVLLAEVIVAWLYSSALHSSRWQATIGKHMLGLCVTDSEGRPITFMRASARHLSTSLVWLTFGVGFAVILLPSRQAVHDAMASTLVVRRRRLVADRPVSTTHLEAQWYGDRQKLRQPDSAMPIRLRLPTPAWWFRLLAVLCFAFGLVFVALAAAGGSNTVAFGVSMVGWLALTVALIPFTVRQGRMRRAAWDAAMVTAFQHYHEPGELLRASSIVYLGLRPWLLELILAHWIVRLILPRGCLLVTDRRLLLLGVNRSGTAITRLERMEQLGQVGIATQSAGVFRPRLVLTVAAKPGLQVTFPSAWRSQARTVVAAISPGISALV
jgi:uncharacterized RDD family membrane protein YckC